MLIERIANSVVGNRSESAGQDSFISSTTACPETISFLSVILYVSPSANLSRVSFRTYLRHYSTHVIETWHIL